MKITSMLWIIGGLLGAVPYVAPSLIVPEEFATLLGIVFSTIPQVKKGTDSRFGFGYRFGNHADAQVVVELGPQKNTQKLGDTDPDSDNFTNKRHANSEDYNKPIEAVSGEEWLKSWSKNAQKGNKGEDQKESEDIQQNPAKIKVMPFIPETSLKQLMSLYKKEEIKENNTENYSQKIKAPEDISDGDSIIQFQDRHRVFLKKPTSDKLDNYAQLLKHDKKKKVAVDLMDVSLD